MPASPQALVGDSVENVGYVIPTPVIQHFLVDYQRTGGFTGFPALGIRWQRLESDALKRAFGMTPEQKGGTHASRASWIAWEREGKVK
eukprot:scaffold3303_cov23-Tisochrysis_lutea.AAC.1